MNKFIKRITLKDILLAPFPLLWLANLMFERIRGKTLAILGMQASGKTSFYDQLKGISRTEYRGTNYEEVDSFTLDLGDRKVRIKKGLDIGGGEEYIKSYYNDKIKDNDVVLFVFDVSKYLSDKEYLRKCEGRFDYIYRHSEGKQIYIVGSHLDQCEGDGNQIIQEVKNITKNKEYSSFFGQNFSVINIRDRRQVLSIAKKMF